MIAEIKEKLYKCFTKIVPLGNYVRTIVTVVAMALLLHMKEFENIG